MLHFKYMTATHRRQKNTAEKRVGRPYTAFSLISKATPWEGASENGQNRCFAGRIAEVGLIRRSLKRAHDGAHLLVMRFLGLRSRDAQEDARVALRWH